MNINSAFRTASHNAKQKKAAKYSQHLYGKAADIWIAGVSVDTLAAYVETLLPGKGGIGRYHADGFVHVDVRGGKKQMGDVVKNGICTMVGVIGESDRKSIRRMGMRHFRR